MFKQYKIFIFLLVFHFSIILANCDGDSNIDEIINIQDIVIVLNHILGYQDLDGINFSNSNVNGDLFITIVDVLLIVEIIISGDNECDIKLDLSQEWIMTADPTYFDYETLNQFFTNNVSNLTLIEGLIIIHKGKIVGEEYYSPSFMNEIFETFSITKSFTGTLTGIALDNGYLDNTATTLSEFFPEYISSGNR